MGVMKQQEAKNPIKVSILVPICNVEKYLRQCLDSLVNQTLAEIEIICIDDGSTDSSPEIIQEYAENDARIKVITKPNSGYGDSMNQGLKKARGEYIGIVESDDYIETDAFEKLYALAKEFDADVARSNFYRYKGGKNEIYCCIDPLDVGRLINPKERTGIFYQQPAIWSAIYRREFLKAHKIEFLPTPGASYQDTSFNFKVWATTERAVFTEEAFLHYRLDNEKSSVNSPGKVFNVAIEYGEIERYLRANGLYEQLKELFQMAKFGSYYWNIYRLTPDLRREFVERAKTEYEAAAKEGSLNSSLFAQPQWQLLEYILAHDTDASLRYIRRTERQIKLKQALKRNLKKFWLATHPGYRKQQEIARLIGEIANENYALRQKVRELEKQNGKND